MLNSLVCNSLTYFWNLFLNNGMMIASFHSKGATPYFNDKLNTVANGILVCSAVSISSFGGIPSTPGDLSFFIAFIFLATIYQSHTPDDSHSPKRPSMWTMHKTMPQHRTHSLTFEAFFFVRGQ